MNKDNILGIILEPKSIETILNIDEVLTEIHSDREDQAKKTELERRKDKQHEARKRQLQKRKKADGLGLITRLFGNKSERKKKSEGINKWLIMGLGLVGGGFMVGLAVKKREEIGRVINEKIDELKEDIKVKLNDAKNSVIESLQKKAEEAGNNLKSSITNFIGGLLGDFGKITPPMGDEMSDRNSALDYDNDTINQRLNDAGLNNQGTTMGRGAQRPEITEEQEEVRDAAENLRDQLAELKSQLQKDLKKITNSRGRVTDKEAEEEIIIKFNERVMALFPEADVVPVEAEKRQVGGAVGIATNVLKKDEALSSLSRGRNDYVKPGGLSVVSKTPWDSIGPSTRIHAYRDSVGQPTIGWGSTFYDSIFSGIKPVRMGDTITKSKADQVLNDNVAGMQKTYASKIGSWNKMTDNQRAGVLVMGYNAPNAPIGSYRKLTAALNKGDMVSAAKNMKRRGPSPARQAEERRLILSGPQDLTNVPERSTTPPVAPPPVKEDNWWTNITNMFRPQQPKKYQMGGVVSGQTPNKRFDDAHRGVVERSGTLVRS